MTSSVIPSEEGELHWIPIGEVTGLQLSAIIPHTLAHYMTDSARDRIHIGVFTMRDGNAAMAWSALADPGVF